MEFIPQFLLFLPLTFFFFSIPAQSATSCKPDSCSQRFIYHHFGPTVRYPFRLGPQHPARCGKPGFRPLSCDSRNRTIINLPGSGEFVVNYIDYTSQTLSVRDPDSCLPNRILQNLSLSGSPFQSPYERSYTFLNCSWQFYSPNSNESLPPSPYTSVGCSSGENYTVLVANLDSPSDAPVLPRCWRIGNFSVPVKWTGPDEYWPTAEVMADVDLAWSDPACLDCENQGRICGFADDSDAEIGCYAHKTSKSSGLPRSARYGIIIGVGVPGVVCIIGLICYTCRLLKKVCLRPQSDPHIPVAAASESVTTAKGLDAPTIESYPITVLGESCRFSHPNDGICPICLCEYRPKDTLKSIPECNHSFHVGCIDEWLGLNGTCPLCRNSPDGSIATTSSSLSSSTLLSSTSNNGLSRR